MAGCRFNWTTGFAFTLALTIVQAAWSQSSVPPAQYTGPTSPSAAVTKVYSLSELGDDPNLCKWIAETIPQMIQPGSWQSTEGKKNLSFYAPGRVMVINHTPAVHAQVDDFLQGLRKSLPPRMKHDAQVVPVQFVPESGRPAVPMTASQAYPVPMLPQAPKHLFHFIIRYEGEGIIDSNVTKFAEVLSRAQAMNEGKSNLSSAIPMMLDPLVTPASNTTNSPSLPQPMYLNKAPQMLPPSEAPRMPPADPSSTPARTPAQTSSYSSPTPALPTFPDPPPAPMPLGPQPIPGR